MAAPAEEILERHRVGGVTHSQVRDPLALWQHEQLRARDRFMTVTTPTGEAETYVPPFNISDTDELTGNSAHVPSLGQDQSDLVARLIARGAE